MPPFDTDELTDAVHRLEAAGPADRAEIAIEIQRLLLEQPNRWGNFPAVLRERYQSMLEADRPAVRSVGALAAGHFAAADDDFYEHADAVDSTAAAAAVVDGLDDASPLVRQVAAGDSLTCLDDVVSRVLDDPEFQPLPTEELAVTLLARLRDDDPTVRLRIGAVVFTHGDALLRAHPDTRTAVETLVGTFDDDLNAHCAYSRPTVAPRHAAYRALEQALGAYDATLVVENIGQVTARLAAEIEQGHWSVVALVNELRAAGHISVDDIEDDIITAAERRDADGWRSLFPALALRTALAGDDAVGPVYEHLQTRYTAANTTETRWRGRDPYLLALSRLVRVADYPFDPHAETLARVIAQETTATDGTDPLVLLASDHPEFVAEQLRQGYEQLVEGDIDHRSRFDTDLVVAVADRNPAAIEGVPTVLAEDFGNGRVQKVVTAVVDAHPEYAAHTVPDGFANTEWEAPLSTRCTELIEGTAVHWERVPDDVVEALADTAGYSYTDRWAAERRGAVRALVALHKEGIDVLPEGFGPFVDLYDEGAFDEDGDDEPIDPLETDAAECAGLH